MNVIPVLLVCSLLLVVGSIVLFVFSARQGDCDEADRLCLLPLDDDAKPSAAPDADDRADDPAQPSTNPSPDRE